MALVQFVQYSNDIHTWKYHSNEKGNLYDFFEAEIPSIFNSFGTFCITLQIWESFGFRMSIAQQPRYCGYWNRTEILYGNSINSEYVYQLNINWKFEMFAMAIGFWGCSVKLFVNKIVLIKCSSLQMDVLLSFDDVHWKKIK